MCWIEFIKISFVYLRNWQWTRIGCDAVYSNYTHVTCRCDHLAAIALQREPKVGGTSSAAILLYITWSRGSVIIILITSSKSEHIP